MKAEESRELTLYEVKMLLLLERIANALDRLVDNDDDHLK